MSFEDILPQLEFQSMNFLKRRKGQDFNHLIMDTIVILKGMPENWEDENSDFENSEFENSDFENSELEDSEPRKFKGEKIQSMENSELGKFSVWKIQSAENSKV